jgi:hypothetical protein
MAAFEETEKSQDSDCRTEGQPIQSHAFKEFCRDRENIRSLGVTPSELEALSRASLLGALTCRGDVLFILRLLRENVIPTKVEMTTPDAHEMTETLRHAALRNLNKRDSRNARPSLSVWRRIRKMLGGSDSLSLVDRRAASRGDPCTQ